MTPDELAYSLTATFLERGNYELAGTGIEGMPVQGAQAAASEIIEEFYSENEGIAGLAVQAVGVTRGAENEEVIIYVTRGSKKALREVPDNVDGVGLEVKLLGKLKVSPDTAMATVGNGHLFERAGRIAGGSSVAPSGVNYSGTLGGFAFGGGQIFAISNNHVFADCNHMPIGMPILSPSAMDARPTRRAPTAFCKFDNMVELRSGSPDLVVPMTMDAAFAQVEDPDLISSWQGDDADGYDTPSAVASPIAGLRVKKFGRTTGLTTGVVEAQLTKLHIPYKSKRFTASVWFEQSWTVLGDHGTPFALPGDSGSLVVTEDGKTAVGMIFAANSQGGYGIMFEIADFLQLAGNWQLLSNHGLG